MNEPQGPTPSSLASEQQQLTRTRIARAAMEVVAQRGFDATVDEIAQLSGVSPRTVFRHYTSHDLLIAATVRDMFEACGRYPIEGLPRIVDDLGAWIDRLPQSFDDLESWLESLAVTVHTRTARIFGRAFWDIHAPNPTASAALSELAVFRRQYRLQGVGYLTTVAWRTAGGVGDPPEDLVLAFALNLSAFTTHSLMIDFDKNPTEVGVLTADILNAFVRSAVDDQQSTGGDRRRSTAATE